MNGDYYERYSPLLVDKSPAGVRATIFLSRFNIMDKPRETDIIGEYRTRIVYRNRARLST